MKNYQLKFNVTKQLYLFKKSWLPAEITIGLEHKTKWFDFYNLTFYFPCIKNGASWDFSREDEESLTISYGIKLPTEILFLKSKGYKGFVIKILGAGIGLHRQWNY